VETVKIIPAETFLISNKLKVWKLTMTETVKRINPYKT
jgi:hypothetical protein